MTIIYRIQTGEIVSAAEVEMPEAAVAAATQSKEYGAIPGFVRQPGEHFVWRGRLYLRPPRPSPHHEWEWPSRTWHLNADKAWAAVRATRDRRLAESDWTTLPDVPLTDQQRAAWRAYRQALRDVTKQTDPLNIRWPDRPQP